MRKVKVLSLFWHSVEPNCINPDFLDGLNPTVSQFREQIEYLVEHYTPISVEDFVRINDAPSLLQRYRKPPVLLGFDDGFKNVVENALPVLTQFQVPALFFVIGEVLKNPSFVPWYVERAHMTRR